MKLTLSLDSTKCFCIPRARRTVSVRNFKRHLTLNHIFLFDALHRMKESQSEFFSRMLHVLVAYKKHSWWKAFHSKNVPRSLRIFRENGASKRPWDSSADRVSSPHYRLGHPSWDSSRRDTQRSRNNIRVHRWFPVYFSSQYSFGSRKAFYYIYEPEWRNGSSVIRERASS